MQYGYHPYARYYSYQDYLNEMERRYPGDPYYYDYYPDNNRRKKHKNDRRRDHYYEQSQPYAQGPYPGSYQGSMYPNPYDPAYDEAPSSATKLLSYVGPIMNVLGILGPKLLGMGSFLPF